MIAVRDTLIRGSEKIIAHFRLLLASAKTEKERERRLLDHLKAACRHGAWPELPDRQGSLHRLRDRVEAARSCEPC